MKRRRHPLRLQMAAHYAAATLVTGIVVVAVSFGAVEGDTSGLVDALIGLGVITIVAVMTGWAVARYTLKPLRAVSEKAQQISATSLHQRIGLQGPDDELQQLATTIDDLLSRLEAGFERERRFVANASHEIRTPLAVTRTALELGLNNSNASVAELRSVTAQALDATARTETLVADLMLLAQSERVAVELCDRFDLAELASEVVNDFAGPAIGAGIEIGTELSPAPMWGNTGLVDRLIANLVDNAIRYSAANRSIRVTTETIGSHALLVVRNQATDLIRDPIDELFEPFHRGSTGRVRTAPTGHGLGLSIVQAIARSHGAKLEADHDMTSSEFRVAVRFDADHTMPSRPRRPPEE